MESDCEAGEDYSDCEYDIGKKDNWIEKELDIDPDNEITYLSLNNSDKPISMDVIQDNLGKLVEDHCCWGSKALKRLKSVVIDNMFSYICIREYFIENRSLEWKYEPFKGQTYSPYDKEQIDAWKIYIKEPAPFVKREHNTVLPYSSLVLTCFKCRGRGRITCPICNGRGNVRCSSCGGSGRVTYTRRDSNGRTHTERRTCSRCGGSGRVTCYRCHGSGEITCPSCKGSGRLLWFLRLRILFQTLQNTSLIDYSDLPESVLSSATSRLVYQKEGDQITCPNVLFKENQSIMSLLFDNASLKIPEKDRLIRERVSVFQIPVSKAVLKWQRKVFPCWIYGEDHSCYCAQYPQRCCGCCDCCSSVCEQTKSR